MLFRTKRNHSRLEFARVVTANWVKCALVFFVWLGLSRNGTIGSHLEILHWTEVNTRNMWGTSVFNVIADSFSDFVMNLLEI